MNLQGSYSFDDVGDAPAVLRNPSDQAYRGVEAGGDPRNHEEIRGPMPFVVDRRHAGRWMSE